MIERGRGVDRVTREGATERGSREAGREIREEGEMGWGEGGREELCVCVEERAACRIVDSEAEGGRGDDSEQGVGHGGGPARDHHQRVQLFDRLVKSDLTSCRI